MSELPQPTVNGKICVPSQTAVYGVAVTSACLGGLWFLRWMTEAAEPWLMTTAKYDAQDSVMCIMWSLITLVPCILYLWTAELAWRSASELNGQEAMKSRAVMWSAYATSALKLGITFLFVSLVDDKNNPYSAFHKHMLQWIIGAVVVALSVLSWLMASTLVIFERESSDSSLVCLL